MLVQPSISSVISSGELYSYWLLSCQFNAPNCHLSLVLASVVQGDADASNRSYRMNAPWWTCM